MSAAAAVALWEVIKPIVVALLGWAATKWLNAKTGNETVNGALVRLWDTVGTVVSELEQTVVRELKARSADGVLSKEDIEAVKQTAMAKVKSYLGPAGLDLVKRVLKLDENALAQLISGKIEAAVFQLKQPAGLPPFLSSGKPVAPAAATLPPFYQGDPR